MTESFTDLSRLTVFARDALARNAATQILEYGGVWYTWGDFAELRSRIDVLMADLPASAPVTMILRNRPSAVAALLSVIAAGRSVKMVYAFQSSAALVEGFTNNPPAVVLASKDCLGAEALQWVEQHGVTAIELDDMATTVLNVGGAQADAALEGPAPSIHILTSGTTGLPKQLPFSFDFFAEHHVAPKLSERDWEVAHQDTPLLLTFPISNITGMLTFLPVLLSGQRAILVDRFSLSAWLDWVQRFCPANAGLPPAGIQMILDADIPKKALMGVQCVGTGAAPLDVEVQRAFEERYNIPILISYGATEFGGPVTAMTPELHAQWGPAKRGSVGRPLPGVELRIIDADTGAPLPDGEEGLLEVFVPRMGGKWVRTSDIALIDSDGFLYHRGRADGAIMRGGFKIVPEVIERHLRQLPAIADVAVVGRKDHRLGEVPVAALVLKPGAAPLSDADLNAFVRKHLPATHVPAKWLYVDQLPRNASFKLDRLAIGSLLE